MSKVETPEKLAKRKAKEQKELAKWRKELDRPKRKYYMVYLMVVLGMVFVMDTVATEICTKMKAEISKSLTQYMVPTAYLQLKEMPMTPNGKTDVKALPEPQLAVSGAFFPPRLPEGVQCRASPPGKHRTC